MEQLARYVLLSYPQLLPPLNPVFQQHNKKRIIFLSECPTFSQNSFRKSPLILNRENHYFYSLKSFILFIFNA